MKTIRVCIVPALCLVMFGAVSTAARDQAAAKEASVAFETTRIKAGLDKMGIGQGYEIVVADERDLVENTAAEVLQRFLARASLSVAIVPESKASGEKRLLLGRDANLQAIRKLGDKGELNIRSVSAEDDGFHLKRIGRDIVIAGANPRGVLYGVYAFEDFTSDGANGNLDVRKIPAFRKRGSGSYYSAYGFSPNARKDFPEEKAVYLSRMGINQLTDAGIGGSLFELVTSDVFPHLPPPQADYQRKIRAMSALCKKYGIDQYLWLEEPTLSGDLAKYPAEALGTVKRPWGGDKNGMARTLCVSSPIVQEYFRNGMRNLVREYPDIKGVLFYNLDVRAWLCTPGLCERCRAVCKDSPPGGFNPWETQAGLITLLAKSAHEVNAGFDFKFWGPVHYHGEHFDRMIHAAQGFDSLVGSWTAEDRSVMVPDAAVPDPAFILSQEISRERNLPFQLICEMNNMEATPRSLPFPLHVSDALKKYRRWGVQNLTEIVGPVPEHNPINALVMKAFQWDPDQDPGKFIAGLARRQFGETAGEWMYRSWEETGRAFDVWNDIRSGPFPLWGSQFHVKLGTAIGGLPPPILPDIVKYYDSIIGMLGNVEPWLADGYQRYKTPAFLDKMQQMSAHLAKAAEQARQAVATASGREYIDVGYYEEENGRPTRKEYAELNHAPIAIADALCRQRINVVRAYHLLTGMERDQANGDGKSAQAKENQYLDLIREDIGMQERFGELLADFARMQPCYTRTSLTDQEIADHLSATQDKIRKLKAFLATKGR